jgi:hypothetical protein
MISKDNKICSFKQIFPDMAITSSPAINILKHKQKKTI